MASDLLHPTTKSPDTKRPPKRSRSLSDEGDAALPASTSKKTKITGPDSVPFWGAQAIKPLTEDNLELLQDIMSNPSQTNQQLSRKGSIQHRRVSQLSSSSKRSYSESGLASEPDPASETSSSTRAITAINPRFPRYLKDCGFDSEAEDLPNKDDVSSLKRVMARERDSPEPDRQLFHLTRSKLKPKNEVSVMKRLSPMLFPYRDLPTNNSKTKNLVYHDDVSWDEWGSNKPGFLPKPKPDLCIAFDEKAFTATELAKMTSPYLAGTSYAPSFTLEAKTALQSMDIAERQNANNMIPLLQRDFTLQKSNHNDKEMERRIRFISTTHNTKAQNYHVWFYVLKDDGTPTWCSHQISYVDFQDPDDSGFETARRANLNLCEYISDTVFKDLRKALAGPEPDTAASAPPSTDGQSSTASAELAKRSKK
ncbi:MAG: hypothetical protein Q9170_002895 [Blastenia crenularia]